MKIRFKENRETICKGQVVAGVVYDISKKEAEAFIKNGVAVKVKEEK